MTNDKLEEANRVLGNLVQVLYSDELKASGKPVVFFVLGGPGVGKGTQCAKLV